MNNQNASYLKFNEALRLLDDNEVVHDLVSIGSATSLLFPTLRWNEPAFTFFAGSSLMRRGAPVRRGPPDFWGAFDARTFRVLILAQFNAIPFGTENKWVTFEVPDFNITLDEMDDQRMNLARLMDAVVPNFFLHKDGILETRRDLSLLLTNLLPGPLLEQSMCLAPDFFSWLAHDMANRSEFDDDGIINRKVIHGVTNYPEKLEQIAELLSSLMTQDDGLNMKQSERNRLGTLSLDFLQYADEIGKIGPSGNAFDATWVFQKILSDARAISEIEILDKSPRWQKVGVPLLKSLADASYSELSSLSDSGRH